MENNTPTLYAIINLEQVITLDGVVTRQGRNLTPQDLGLKLHQSVVFDDRQILFIGSEKDRLRLYPQAQTTCGRGQVLTPAFADSHTHLVFGGSRSEEYLQRLNGESYQNIASRGGGILSTVRQTKNISFGDLYQASLERLKRMKRNGVRAVEIKTGYGLDIETEEKQLRVILALKESLKNEIHIHTTYLGAHAVPSNYSSSNHYLHQIVIPQLKEIYREIDSVDIFVEENYFDLTDAKELFEVALALGKSLKVHAEEFSRTKASLLAQKMKALSADHLLYCNEEDAAGFGASNTVATLLPGTHYFLGKKLAPSRMLAASGAKLAIATDFNPGSSHFSNLLQLAKMTSFQLGFCDAAFFASIAYNSFQALGIQDAGAIQVGYKPWFNRFKTAKYQDILYTWDDSLLV